MPLAFHRQTVTRVRAGVTTDRYNDQVVDWFTPDLLDIPGCRLQPALGGADEAATTVIDRDQLNKRWLLFAPPGADITGSDRIHFNGVDHEVLGDVRRWSSPSGRLDHIEADLLRVEG